MSSQLTRDVEALRDRLKTFQQVHDYFAERSEKQRLALWDQREHWLPQEWKTLCIDGDLPDAPVHALNMEYLTRRLPSLLALRYTVDLDTLRTICVEALPHDSHLLRCVIVRKPSWIDEALASVRNSSYFHYRALRELIRAGLIEKPDTHEYRIGIIEGLAFKKPVLQQLLNDKALLDEEIWYLFENGVDEHVSLTNADKYLLTDWSGALVSLAASEHLPRQRLLDESLKALSFGYGSLNARWYTGFFDKLDPSDEELSERKETLLDLMQVRTESEIAWVFKKLKRLFKLGVLDRERDSLPAQLMPALRLRASGVPRDAIQLLASLARQDQKLCRKCLHGIAEALAHQHSGVQADAAEVIVELGSSNDEILVEQVRSSLPLVTGKSIALLTKWLDENPELVALEPMPHVDTDSPWSGLYALDELCSSDTMKGVSIPAARFDGSELPRLDPDAQLAPIVDLDELVLVSARALEDGCAIDDYERALDGISRLCNQRPDDFEQRTTALLKRARDILWQHQMRGLSRDSYHRGVGTFAGWGTTNDLAAVIQAWLAGQSAVVFQRGIGDDDEVIKQPKPDIYYHPEGLPWQSEGQLINRSGSSSQFMPTKELQSHRFDVVSIGDREAFVLVSCNELAPTVFFSRIARAIHDRVLQQDARALLCAPTHAGGWIDACALAARAQAFDGTPDSAELILALLRLAPDNRLAALEALDDVDDMEWLQALRYALGEDRLVGNTRALWVAAARARAPFADDLPMNKRWPGLGADAAIAANYERLLEPLDPDVDEFNRGREVDATSPIERVMPRDPLLPTQLLQIDSAACDTEDEWHASEEQSQTMQLSSLWPIALDSLFARKVHNYDNRHKETALLTLLRDPCRPLRPSALLMLVRDLMVDSAEVRVLATDVAAQAIIDGRLGSDNFGTGLRTLFESEGTLLGRWANSLRELSQESVLHAYVVYRSLERALRGTPNARRAGLSALLSLMEDISIEHSISIADPECREYLKGFKGNGKTATAASTLLTASSDKAFAQAVQLAIRWRSDILAKLEARG